MQVYVYFNLHNGLFSIKAMEGPNKGRVVSHARRIHLKDARFHVNEKGRERVRASGKKEVHAGIIAKLVGFEPDSVGRADLVEEYGGRIPPFDGAPVTYNPYRDEQFIQSTTKAPVYHAANVFLGVEEGLRIAA